MVKVNAQGRTPYAVVTTTTRLRIDGRSTEVVKVTPVAVTLTYLFI